MRAPFKNLGLCFSLALLTACAGLSTHLPDIAAPDLNAEKAAQERKRELRRERIVVAELQFIDCYRVVLVYDGNDAVGEQVVDGVLGVEIAGTVAQIGRRQQDLPNVQVHVGEELLV